MYITFNFCKIKSDQKSVKLIGRPQQKILKALEQSGIFLSKKSDVIKTTKLRLTLNYSNSSLLNSRLSLVYTKTFIKLNK